MGLRRPVGGRDVLRIVAEWTESAPKAPNRIVMDDVSVKGFTSRTPGPAHVFHVEQSRWIRGLIPRARTARPALYHVAGRTSPEEPHGRSCRQDPASGTDSAVLDPYASIGPQFHPSGASRSGDALSPAEGNTGRQARTGLLEARRCAGQRIPFAPGLQRDFAAESSDRRWSVKSAIASLTCLVPRGRSPQRNLLQASRSLVS
jgi:hypothetical protein